MTALAPFAFRDHALERGVINWMIPEMKPPAVFDWDRAKHLGGGPSFENAARFETKVEMQSPCSVLLDDEVTAYRRLALVTLQLKGACKVAFDDVFRCYITHSFYLGPQ